MQGWTADSKNTEPKNAEKKSTKKWYAPLLMLGAFLILYTLFSGILLYLAGAIYSIARGNGLTEAAGFAVLVMHGFVVAEKYSVPWALVTVGINALMIPALIAAEYITRRYGSDIRTLVISRWRWNLFFSYLSVAIVLFFTMRLLVVFPYMGHVKVQISVFHALVMLVLVPLQCLGEELFYRGFLKTSITKLTGFRFVGNITQAFYFAAVHICDTPAKICIFIMAMIWGFTCDITEGLEAVCAAHIVFNAAYFVLDAMGVITTTGKWTEVITYASCAAVSMVYMLICRFIIARRERNRIPVISE